ncbi:MAG TPA: T9SS type A sorting domain-containing protein [Parafilimonas sp.]|nr:T9SS type A sorting domain-containing protein [Parafilimonas sp.]
MIQAQDGNYIASGGLQKINLIKLNPEGQLIWSKTVNLDNSSNVYNNGNGIVNTNDSGFAISGSYAGNPVISKFDADGNLEWSKRYIFNSKSNVSNLLQTSDSGYLLATSIYVKDSATSYLIKTDPGGSIQWVKNYFAHGLSQVTDLKRTADSNYVFVTINSSNTGLFGDTSHVIKIDPSGNVLWDKYIFYPEGMVYGHNLTAMPSGGCIVSGHHISSSGSAGFVIRLNTNGITNWSKAITSAATFSGALKIKDGNYIIYGNLLSADSTFYLFYKIDRDGNTQWSKIIYSNGNGGTATNMFSLIKTSDNGYLGVGWQAGAPGVILKLDSGFNSCNYQGTSDNLSDFVTPGNSTVFVVDKTIAYDNINVVVTQGGSILTACSVLPLQFNLFTATSKNSSVQLQWQTTNEINNDYFSIERSADSKTFISIGKISALKSVNINKYAFNDNNPLKGKNYYRLKQFDKDGKYTYSGIVSIIFEGQERPAFVISPNPADNFITVTVPPVNGVSKIVIYDIAGKKIISSEMGVQTTLKTMDIKQLAPGIYHVVLLQNGIKQTLRFVKNR